MFATSARSSTRKAVAYFLLIHIDAFLIWKKRSSTLATCRRTEPCGPRSRRNKISRSSKGAITAISSGCSIRRNIDDFRDLLNLNSVAPLVVMQAVIPYMRSQGAGSIVNVSSGATLATYPGSAAYTSSKSALNMLSSVARLELADAGIVVSIMHPSITATEFYGSVKSGLASAKAQEAETESFAQPPKLVAEIILGLVRSGEAQADLVPKEYGGSFEG